MSPFAPVAGPLPTVPLTADDLHERMRRKAHRAPSWLLRRRERRIVAGNPSGAELVELGAIRRELWLRSLRRAPRR